MARTRPAFIVGLLLFLAACGAQCQALARWSASGVPYQDPTPQLQEQQVQESIALADMLTRWTLVSAVLLGAALCSFGYGAWRSRQSKRQG